MITIVNSIDPLHTISSMLEGSTQEKLEPRLENRGSAIYNVMMPEHKPTDATNGVDVTKVQSPLKSQEKNEESNSRKDGGFFWNI